MDEIQYIVQCLDSVYSMSYAYIRNSIDHTLCHIKKAGNILENNDYKILDEKQMQQLSESIPKYDLSSSLVKVANKFYGSYSTTVVRTSIESWNTNLFKIQNSNLGLVEAGIIAMANLNKSINESLQKVTETFFANIPKIEMPLIDEETKKDLDI